MLMLKNKLIEMGEVKKVVCALINQTSWLHGVSNCNVMVGHNYKIQKLAICLLQILVFMVELKMLQTVLAPPPKGCIQLRFLSKKWWYAVEERCTASNLTERRGQRFFA